MTDKSTKHLIDILMAIKLIEKFTSEINDFNFTFQIKKTQSTVERQLAIIGETLNHFRKVESKFQIENDTQIVFLRNRLIHSYDNIDEAIIWAILKRHILPFKKEVEKLLE